MVPCIEESGDGRAIDVHPLLPPGWSQVGAAMRMGHGVAALVDAGIALQIAGHNLQPLQKLYRSDEIVDAVVLTPVADYLVEVRALAAPCPAFLQPAS